MLALIFYSVVAPLSLLMGWLQRINEVSERPLFQASPKIFKSIIDP